MGTHTHCILLFIATAAEHLVVSAHFLPLKESLHSPFLPGQQKIVIFYPYDCHTHVYCHVTETEYHTGALFVVLHYKWQRPEEAVTIYRLLAAHTCGRVVQLSTEHLRTQSKKRGTLEDRMGPTPSL